MATITINGKPCEFEGQKMILEVAKENNIEIPHYCYHEGLSITASCRICLGEVWAPNPRNDNKLEAIPRLMPTCQTPAGDGQKVYTDSPKAVANQKAVMEYLLLNHPLDCPICDQAGECGLQDYSYQFGRSESRFVEDKIKQPKKDLGDDVYLYSDRCIMCTRCVRFTREITETNELCVVGRGSDEQIDLFPGLALNNPLSGNVVDICPVGALLDKDFQFQQRVWFMKNTPSIDGLTAGGDNISIHHNDGKIYRIKPRRNLAVNKWWISNEIRYGWKFIESEERFTAPSKLQYGERVPTTFANAYAEIDEALTAIASKQGKIAALVSPMIPCEEAYLLCDYVRHWHENPADAILGVGPIPVEGEDQTFPPGVAADAPNAYTIHAEKAPNARGVQRILKALAALDGNEPTASYDEFLKKVKAAEAVIITGNFPSAWATKDLTKALTKKFVILIDTLPNEVSKKANVILPAATFMEKAGTFENANHLIQAFERAIQPIEGTKSEGQILTDLITIAEGKELAESTLFNSGNTRLAMATNAGLNEFIADVQFPMESSAIPDEEYEMALVEI